MERRTILELVALYELEPRLKDVYVEGPSDGAFVRSALRHLGLAHVQVYEIDLIDVPYDVLIGLSLGVGNRQRVMALALELERLSACDLSRRVCCVVDADDEAGKPPRVRGALLLYTDFTCMQMYSFTSAALQRYLDQVVLNFPLPADRVLSIVEPVLRQCAVSRRANTALSLNTAPVDLTDDCQLSATGISFDTERFTARFLNKAAASHRRAEYESECARIEALLPPQPAFWAHGEDFVDLLHWIVVRRKGTGRTVPREFLGKALLLAVPLADAAVQPLFVELGRRLS